MNVIEYSVTQATIDALNIQPSWNDQSPISSHSGPKLEYSKEQTDVLASILLQLLNNSHSFHERIAIECK
jgi:hypothetical protein